MDDVLAYIGRELPAINAFLERSTEGLDPIVKPPVSHVLKAGGKRLRPLLTLLTARAAGLTDADPYPLACSLEILHSATLLHDDILDGAELRRGNASAHTVYGKSVTILAGDVLLALANRMVAGYGEPRLTDVLSEAILRTVTGEVKEIAATRDVTVSEDDYLDIITGKTAYLFQGACQAGAILAGASPELERSAHDYGLNLGIAFQLVDDALDYVTPLPGHGQALGRRPARGQDDHAAHPAPAHPGPGGPGVPQGGHRRRFPGRRPSGRGGRRRAAGRPRRGHPTPGPALYRPRRPGPEPVRAGRGDVHHGEHPGVRHLPGQIAMTDTQDALTRTLASLHHCQEMAFPPVMAQLLKELVKPEPDFDDIARIIGLDPVMSATVLNLVNSSFYALSQKVTDLSRAAVVLGSKEILKIALSLSFLKSQAKAFDKAGGNRFANWRILVWAAIASQLLAERICPEQSDAVYLCALLKDLSLLVTWCGNPEALPHMGDDDLLVCLRDGQMEAETEAWGAPHPELTVRLLESWGIPDLGCEAILHHHDMDDMERLTPMAQALALGTRWSELVNSCGPSPLPLVQFETMLQARVGLTGSEAEDMRQACVQKFRSMLRILDMGEAEPEQRLYEHSVQSMQNYYFQSMDVMQVRGGPARAAEAVARHLRWNFGLADFDLALRAPGSGEWLLFIARGGGPPEQEPMPARPEDLAWRLKGNGRRLRASGEIWGELRMRPDALDEDQSRDLALYLLFLGRAYQDYLRRQAVLETKARTLDNLPVGVARLDPQGRILELNNILYQFLGTPANPMGADIFQFLTRTRDLKAEREWRQFLVDPERSYLGKIFCTHTPGESAAYRCFYLSARRTAQQGREEILFLLEDVSEISDLELQAFKQGAFLERLVESMQDVVMTVVPDGTVTFASPGLAETVTGRNLFDIVTPEDRDDGPAWGPALLESGAPEAPVEASLDAGGDAPLRLELVFSPLETEESEKAFLIVGRDLTTVRRLEEKLRRQALYDGLTGLYNRHQFHAIMEREARRAGRTGRGMGLVFFDLDGFKAINDTLGHQAGDKVLKSIARMLRDSLRKGTDYACRYGGDEFAAILTEVDQAGLRLLGERVMTASRSRFKRHGLSLSMGVGMLGPDEDPENLIKRCDEAAYKAKADGGDAMVTATGE